MATVAYRQVEKIYPDGTRALEKFDLDIADGEMMVLVGPSGCGKSTALRLLAGLESVTRGELLIGGKRVNRHPPEYRDIAMVFQNYALYPHMTVRRNLEFPLRMRKFRRKTIALQVEETARLLGLTDLLEQRPAQLSGGQRQRVAMGRAIVRRPQVFLMDEPLSNLDARLRVQIRSEIATLQRRLCTTTLYVTHDQVEAMTLGDRVAVLNDGRLQQVGSPQTLYDRPANAFVAAFLGNPGMNIFPAMLRRRSDMFELTSGRVCIALDSEKSAARHPHLLQYLDCPLLAGLRPEGFSARSAATIEVTVDSVESLGHERLLYFRLEPPVTGVTQQTLVARLPGPHKEVAGQTVRLGVATEQLSFFTIEGNAIT